MWQRVATWKEEAPGFQSQEWGSLLKMLTLGTAWFSLERKKPHKTQKADLVSPFLPMRALISYSFFYSLGPDPRVPPWKMQHSVRAHRIYLSSSNCLSP